MSLVRSDQTKNALKLIFLLFCPFHCPRPFSRLIWQHPALFWHLGYGRNAISPNVVLLEIAQNQKTPKLIMKKIGGNFFCIVSVDFLVYLIF